LLVFCIFVQYKNFSWFVINVKYSHAMLKKSSLELWAAVSRLKNTRYQSTYQYLII